MTITLTKNKNHINNNKFSQTHVHDSNGNKDDCSMSRHAEVSTKHDMHAVSYLNYLK